MSYGISTQDVALVMTGLFAAAITGYGGYKFGSIKKSKLCNSACLKGKDLSTEAKKAAALESCNRVYPVEGGDMMAKAAMFGGPGLMLAVFLFIVIFVINGTGMGGGYGSSGYGGGGYPRTSMMSSF